MSKQGSGRYALLYDAIDTVISSRQEHLCFLEIGTYDGNRAAELLLYWYEQTGGTSTYIGFDLFEDLTPQRSKAEMSKSRLPPSLREVENRLKRVPGSKVYLYKGDTRDTLANFAGNVKIPVDVIFMDGGHSLETVASDWSNVEKIAGDKTIVLLDDYYDNRDDFGVQRLVNELKLGPVPYRVVLSDPPDVYEHTKLSIRMARVTRAAS